MDRRIDKGQSTRQRILEVATRLFTEQGFDAVSIDAVLGATGLSKGALYHHFESKTALFAAVLEAVEARIAETLFAAGKDAKKPIDALRAGCRAWLDLAAKDATVRRIVLLDAPTAIGWQAWREMDERYSLGLLRAALSAAAQLGEVPEARVALFGNALLAVLIEMALLIARSPDDAKLAEAGHDAAERMLTSLFVTKQRSR